VFGHKHSRQTQDHNHEVSNSLWTDSKYLHLGAHPNLIHYITYVLGSLNETTLNVYRHRLHQLPLLQIANRSSNSTRRAGWRLKHRRRQDVQSTARATMLTLTPKRSSARLRAEGLLSASLAYSPFILFLTKPHDREQPITDDQQRRRSND